MEYELPVVERLAWVLCRSLSAPLDCTAPALDHYENLLAITANISCNTHLYHLVLSVPRMVIPNLHAAEKAGLDCNVLERVLLVLIYNVCKFVEEEGQAKGLMEVLQHLTLCEARAELYRKRLVRMLAPTKFLAIKFPNLIEKAGGFPFVLLESITHISRKDDYVKWGQFLLTLMGVFKEQPGLFLHECGHVGEWMMAEIRADTPSSGFCLTGMAQLASTAEFYKVADLDSLIVECLNRQSQHREKTTLL